MRAMCWTLDSGIGVCKGWVCKRLASGLTCLPITAVEVVRSCCHGSDLLCEEGEKVLEVKRGSQCTIIRPRYLP